MQTLAEKMVAAEIERLEEARFFALMSDDFALSNGTLRPIEEALSANRRKLNTIKEAA